MISQLRIGTRASPLALAQAEQVQAALSTQSTLHRMTTAGDREVQKDLSHWGFKGLFTRELEDALLERRIDMAVHSMKDMPSVLPEGLTIGAVLPREDVRDAWISPRYATLAALPQGGVVGSSSIRRSAQLKRLRPDVRIVPIRGNVQTRLRKLHEGVADATFLACAGLKRLGMPQHIGERIEVTTMLPAVAQAAIAIECRADDAEILALLATINHAETLRCVTAERAMLAVLDGSCRTPIAGYAQLNGDSIHLRAELLMPDGSDHILYEITGNDAGEIGREAGNYLKSHAKPGMLLEA